MTVGQTAEYLLSKNRSFDRNIIYDKDKFGRYFCELIMPNKTQPSLPIALTVTEGGCSVSVGRFEGVSGDKPITPDQALSAITDITADKIIFVLGYADGVDADLGSPFFSRIFALTGGEDDMSRDYEKFIKKLETPIKKQLRFLHILKGSFVISNYSGSMQKTMIR